MVKRGIAIVETTSINHKKKYKNSAEFDKNVLLDYLEYEHTTTCGGGNE